MKNTESGRKAAGYSVSSYDGIELTAAQLSEARVICAEFGAIFAGILDRVDAAEYALQYDPAGLADASRDLLDNINPALARRILAA